MRGDSRDRKDWTQHRSERSITTGIGDDRETAFNPAKLQLSNINNPGRSVVAGKVARLEKPHGLGCVPAPSGTVFIATQTHHNLFADHDNSVAT